MYCLYLQMLIFTLITGSSVKKYLKKKHAQVKITMRKFFATANKCILLFL